MKVGQQAVQAVGHRRARRAPGLIGRSEHEVVDQKLGAAVEQLGEGPRPVVGIKPVLLLDRNPGQFAALARQLVRHPGVLLLALKQLVMGGLPLLTADNLVVSHLVLSPLSSPAARWSRFARFRSVCLDTTEDWNEPAIPFPGGRGHYMQGI